LFGGLNLTHIWQLPITIEQDSFVFHGVEYTICKKLDRWLESGAWWLGEPMLEFVLVATKPQGLFEIAITPQGETLLYQSFD